MTGHARAAGMGGHTATAVRGQARPGRQTRGRCGIPRPGGRRVGRGRVAKRSTGRRGGAARGTGRLFAGGTATPALGRRPPPASPDLPFPGPLKDPAKFRPRLTPAALLVRFPGRTVEEVVEECRRAHHNAAVADLDRLSFNNVADVSATLRALKLPDVAGLGGSYRCGRRGPLRAHGPPPQHRPPRRPRPGRRRPGGTACERAARDDRAGGRRRVGSHGGKIHPSGLRRPAIRPHRSRRCRRHLKRSRRSVGWPVRLPLISVFERFCGPSTSREWMYSPGGAPAGV